MGKFFGDFADSGVGSWVINGLSVVAFLIVLKLLVSRLQDNGVPGAFKAVVNFA
jgi:hypothetical protein